MSLHKITEVFCNSRIRNNNRFAKHSTNLGSANIEYIRQASQIRQSHIITICCKRITQTRAINKQQQIILLANLRDIFQLCQAIDCSKLRRIRDVH